MSGVKNRPATPLPWRSSHDGVVGQRSLIRVADSSGVVKFADDRDYIAHSGNAYEKLVETLREVVFLDCEPRSKTDKERTMLKARALLREIGEDV